MARARKGNKVQTMLGFLMYGEQGTWKSKLCSEFIKFRTSNDRPFRVLYIDGESGSIDTYLEELEKEGINTENTYIVYTQSLAEVREYIKKVRDNEDFYELDEKGEETEDIVLDADSKPFRADAIVIDGTTVIHMATQQGLVEFSKKRATVKADKDQLIGDARTVKIEGAGMELKDYQTVGFKGQDLVLDLLATGKHFAITARETDEKQSVKDNDGKITSIHTGRKIPKGFKDLQYNVKTVLHTFIDDDGIVKAVVENKDRSLVHQQNEILEEPSLMDWQKVIERNKGKERFVLNNSLNDSVKKEKELYEKEINNTDLKESGKDNSGNPETPESYHKAIGEAIAALSPMKRKSLKATVTKAKLPMKYTELTDLDKLKEYLELIRQ
ncbi:hypothetical protein QB607_003091 [Clostridium botulinum]|nr:hypothetical protein [Clostridium botulinum]EKS4395764.1 hypothetical protein [Clostridium botulinum]